MDTTIMFEAARKTLAGKISFPEVVGQLLASYDDVKVRAAVIYDRIRGIGGDVMPPSSPRGEGPWPQDRIELFARWMADGYQP